MVVVVVAVGLLLAPEGCGLEECEETVLQRSSLNTLLEISNKNKQLWLEASAAVLWLLTVETPGQPRLGLPAWANHETALKATRTSIKPRR